MSVPSVRLAFDCVVLAVIERVLHVAVAQRRDRNEINERDPFPGAYSLPGGYVRDTETLAETISRRLGPEIGLELHPVQFRVFDTVDRDPRHRVVSIAHLALIPSDQAHRLTWGVAYNGGSWIPVRKLPAKGWAFDHHTIVKAALAELRYRARREPTGFELLAPQFTLPDLHAIQEQIRQESVDIRNLRRSLVRAGLIVECGETQGGRGLPTKLYRVDPDRLRVLKDQGYYIAT